jgi:hypothetical protein
MGVALRLLPRSHPGEHTSGTAATFEEARAGFERAWALFGANRTPADFQVWRDQRAWTGEKYRRFDRGEKMPPDWSPRSAATTRAPAERP